MMINSIFWTINLEILDENLITMFLQNKWYLPFMFLSIASIRLTPDPLYSKGSQLNKKSIKQ